MQTAHVHTLLILNFYFHYIIQIGGEWGEKGYNTLAHIIYAEDDEFMADIVRTTLQEDGHVVGIADDGENALQAIKAKKPDLVILDCNMPGLSGISVLERMRVDSQLYQTPVLVLTSRSGASNVNLAKFAGANEYMEKPFDRDYLAFIVDEMLAKAAFCVSKSPEANARAYLG
jgi:DNA-binding response OmpR family regulator